MTHEVNLNSDLGESFGPWKMGSDGEMLAIVRSANVACGFHASDPMVMAETAQLAVKNGVSIGAHPGFPDLQGFGRRVMRFSNAEMSEAIARATKAVDRDRIFLCQANPEQGKAARKLGLRVAEEVFADRTYTDAGLLTPRKEANSMIKDPAQAVANVRRMVDEQAIYSTSGKRIPCQVDSICVHGDGPTAVTVSRAVREGLEGAGIHVVPLPELPSLRH